MERLSRFTLLLMNEKRYDDAEKVLKDKEYRDKMLKGWESDGLRARDIGWDI